MSYRVPSLATRPRAALVTVFVDIMDHMVYMDRLDDHRHFLENKKQRNIL